MAIRPHVLSGRQLLSRPVVGGSSSSCVCSCVTHRLRDEDEEVAVQRSDGREEKC